MTTITGFAATPDRRLTVTGTGMTGSTSVTYGGEGGYPATNFRVDSATSASADLPNDVGPGATLVVTVHNPAGDATGTFNWT